MNKEHLEILWKRLASASNVDNLEYHRAVVIGGVFGDMQSEILKQNDEIKDLQQHIQELTFDLQAIRMITNRVAKK